MKRILCVLLLVCLLPVWGLAGEEVEPEDSMWVKETTENGAVMYLPWGIPFRTSYEECQALLLERAGVEMEQPSRWHLEAVEGQRLTVLGFPVGCFDAWMDYSEEENAAYEDAEKSGVPAVYTGGTVKNFQFIFRLNGSDKGIGAYSAMFTSDAHTAVRLFAEMVEQAKQVFGPATFKGVLAYNHQDGIAERICYEMPMRQGKVDVETLVVLSENPLQGRDSSASNSYVFAFSNVSIRCTVNWPKAGEPEMRVVIWTTDAPALYELWSPVVPLPQEAWARQ